MEEEVMIEATVGEEFEFVYIAVVPPKQPARFCGTCYRSERELAVL